MNSIIVFLLAIGAAVADVSELSKAYLPPPLVENAVLSEYSATEAATEAPTTTVVEIEMVPLEEKHEMELPAAAEQPAVPSIYEQPPVLLYGAPVAEVQSEVAAAAAGEAATAPAVEAAVETAVEAVAEAAEEEGSAVAAEELPLVKEIIIVEEVPEEKEIPATEEAPAVTESPVTEEAPVSEESPVTEEAPASEEPAVAVETTSAAAVVEEEAPIVKEAAAEVPAVEAEPEPAHVLAEDGYRYKTATRFRYRF